MTNQSKAVMVVGTGGQQIQIAGTVETAVFDLIDPQSRLRALALAKAVDLNNTISLMDFGMGAQERVSEVATKLLAGVQVNDLNSPVTVELNRLNQAWEAVNPHSVFSPQRGFHIGNALAGKVKAWIQGYQQVNTALDATEKVIKDFKATALTDIGHLDELYREADTLSAYAKEMEAACIYLLGRLIKKYEIESQNLNTADENAVFNHQVLGDVISQIDIRRGLCVVTRGEVVLTKQKVLAIKTMDMNLYLMLTNKLLFALPKMKMDLALMAKLFQAEKAANWLKDFTDLEAKRTEQLNKKMQTTMVAIATQSNDVVQQMARLVDEFDGYTTLLGQVEDIKAKGTEARHQGEAALAQVTDSFSKKASDFKPGEMIKVDQTVMDAATKA